MVLPAGDVVFQTAFVKHLKLWRNTIGKLSSSQLLQLQNDNLSKVLQHATTHIPYYKNLNINLTGNPVNDLKKFPVLTKEILNKKSHLMRAEGETGALHKERSSGSSGLQTTVFMSREEQSHLQAMQVFLWEFNGYKIGDRLLQTGINPNRGIARSIKDVALRTQYVSAFDLSKDKIIGELERAIAGKISYIAGFPSSLNVLAKVAIENNLKIPCKGIMCWGDKLFESYRKNISDAFGNPIIAEQYGSSEGFVIAGSCAAGNYHILTPHVYLELLDDNEQEVGEGEMGHVVVTRLDGFHFPLIRYRLGDLAVKESFQKICSCGRHFPMLRKIVGRETDLVFTTSGKPLIVHFFTGIFEHYPEIDQFCITQKAHGIIEVDYIASNKFNSEVLDKISKEIVVKANEEFDIVWRKVEYIAPTPSGKPQIVKNLIKSNGNLETNI